MDSKHVRRAFLGTVSALSATAALSDASEVGVAMREMNGSIADQFLPLVGKSFHVKADSGTFDLTLTAVDNLARLGHPPQYRDPCSLLFRGSAKLAGFRQQTCQVRNTTLGTFAAFIVPIGTKGEEILFEMVFG